MPLPEAARTQPPPTDSPPAAAELDAAPGTRDPSDDALLALTLVPPRCKLISDGTYAKILAKWDITGYGVATSEVDPTPQL